MWLLAPAVLLPLIEIAGFILVGEWIGVWPTIALVLASGLVGVMLVRRQGLAAMAALRGAARLRGDPARPLLDGAVTLVAGVLLIVPGFLTDLAALTLLLPPVRRALFAALRRRLQVRTARPANGAVIEGEFRELDTDRRG